MNKSKVPKVLAVLCLLFSGIVEIASTQDLTPYPEGYLNELTRVNMSRAPAVFITKGGEEVVTQIKDGRRWNYAWYWDEVRKGAPEMFDADNNLAIDKGYAPRVNDRFLEHNPQFKKFKGQKLHHHHYKQGNIAYALPEVLHTGKGFTKLWHKFGKKAIFVIGTAYAIYQLGAKANPFTESPFELWVQNEAEELELSNLELAMAQGYTTIKKFIENCRSCSNLGVSEKQLPHFDIWQVALGFQIRIKWGSYFSLLPYLSCLPMQARLRIIYLPENCLPITCIVYLMAVCPKTVIRRLHY